MFIGKLESDVVEMIVDQHNGDSSAAVETLLQLVKADEVEGCNFYEGVMTLKVEEPSEVLSDSSKDDGSIVYDSQDMDQPMAATTDKYSNSHCCTPVTQRGRLF